MGADFVPSVIEGTNAELIAQVAKLWIRPTDRVLDPTWGRGLWWSEYEPPAGVYTYQHLRRFDFTQRWPEEDNAFEVVVCDPPYTSKGGRRTSSIDEMDDRYGLRNAARTPELLIRDTKFCLIEAMRVSSRIIMLKTANYVSSGHMVWAPRILADWVEYSTVRRETWKQVDEFIHVRRGKGIGPQPLKNRDGSRRRQVHSRRAHSFLQIFEKV